MAHIALLNYVVVVAADPETNNLRDKLEKLKEKNKRLVQELENVRDFAIKIVSRKGNMYE